MATIKIPENNTARAHNLTASLCDILEKVLLNLDIAEDPFKSERNACLVYCVESKQLYYNVAEELLRRGFAQIDSGICLNMTSSEFSSYKFVLDACNKLSLSQLAEGAKAAPMLVGTEIAPPLIPMLGDNQLEEEKEKDRFF